MGVTPVVLVVRHPDHQDQITVDGDATVIYIDLGSDFDGTPDNEDQAVAWVTDHLDSLTDLDTDSIVYTEALAAIAGAVEDYPAATALIDAFQQRRTA